MMTHMRGIHFIGTFEPTHTRHLMCEIVNEKIDTRARAAEKKSENENKLHLFNKERIAPVQGVHNEIFEPKFGFGVAKAGHAA